MNQEFVLIRSSPLGDYRNVWDDWIQTADPNEVVYPDLCKIKAFGDMARYGRYPSARLEFVNLTDAQIIFKCILHGILYDSDGDETWGDGDTVTLTVDLRPNETRMVKTDLTPVHFAKIRSVNDFSLELELLKVKISRMMQVYP